MLTLSRFCSRGASLLPRIRFSLTRPDVRATTRCRNMHYALSPVPRDKEQEARALGARDLRKLDLWDKNDEELRVFFDSLATPARDGILTADFSAALSQAYCLKEISSPFEWLMVLATTRLATSQMDANSDGVISWDELRGAVRQTEAAMVEASLFSEQALRTLGISSFDDGELERAFAAADADGSGELDGAELAVVCSRINTGLENSPELESMISRVIARFDKDRNGRVSLKEFKDAFALYQLERGWWDFSQGGRAS